VPVNAGNLASVRVRPAVVVASVASAGSSRVNASLGKANQARINLQKTSRVNRKKGDSNQANSRVKVNNRVNNRDNSRPVDNGKGAVNNRAVNSPVAGN
jgi:hypothetical protein